MNYETELPRNNTNHNKVRLLKKMTIQSINIRTKNGKRVQKNKTLYAGEYDIIEKYVINSSFSLFKGLEAYKITDGKYIYAILQKEIENVS